MSLPKVSILIPVYSVEKYIERCVVSLMEQTYENLEYVFVDDCSPDSSIKRLEEIIIRYPKREGQIKIIHHEINRGLSAARNTAVCNSTGDFILHVDSDDYLDVCAVEHLINRQIETNADIVTGQAICIKKNSSTILERPQFVNHQDFILDMIKPSIHHTIWGRLIRRSLYINHHINAKEGVNIGEDLQVMTQLAYHAAKVESIWDVVYHYDCTNDLSYMNLFDTKHIKRLIQDTESMEVVRDFFKEKDGSFLDFAEKYLSQYYLNLLRYYGRAGMKDDFARIRKRMSDLLPQNRKMPKKQEMKYHSYRLFRIAGLLKN
jgi:glycosyltransferase involved in cell wall biosynthesis